MIAPLFRLKICGVREIDHLKVVSTFGGDAVGLNFFPASIRYLAPEQARPLAEAAASRSILPVGVFVNASRDEIRSTVRTVGLPAVQLHGDESPQLAAHLLSDGLRVIRAVRLPAGPISPEQISAVVAPWIAAGAAILFDADAGAAFGGRGLRLDWPSLARWRRESTEAVPFTLAGGLSVESVEGAIRTSGASSVDVASGVESPRGVKSADLIGEFLTRAARGLATSGSGQSGA